MHYDLDNMIETFSRHAQMFEENDKKHKEQFPDRDPNVEWEFCLSRALAEICREIKEIKKVH